MTLSICTYLLCSLVPECNLILFVLAPSFIWSIDEELSVPLCASIGISMNNDAVLTLWPTSHWRTSDILFTCFTNHKT